MKKIQKIILLVLISLPSLTFANSINDYFINNPGWSEEIKEIIYISTRCSGILQVVGQHRIEVEDQEFGPELLEAGRSLGLQSAQLALDEGVSVENIQDRMLYWMKKYAEDSISNTDNFNNIFVGDFADDFTICKRLVDSISQ